MCTVKTPKAQPVKEKAPVYMRNPYLDGLGIGGENRGRNSLRIDPGARVPQSGDKPAKADAGYNDYATPTTGAYSTGSNEVIDAARRSAALGIVGAR